MTTEQKIRQLVPSLQETIVGCLAVQDGKTIVMNKAYKYFDAGLYEAVNEKGNTVMAGFSEILGHEIQLHHVLQAIEIVGKKHPVVQHVDDREESIEGGNWKYFRNKLVDIYDLTKPFSGQTQEVKDFIGELLQ